MNKWCISVIAVIQYGAYVIKLQSFVYDKASEIIQIILWIRLKVIWLNNQVATIKRCNENKAIVHVLNSITDKQSKTIKNI